MNNYFPEEGVSEILSWLPVKSLLRFRRASKAWFQLLTTDHHFIKLHITRLAETQNPGFFHLGNPTPTEAIRLQVPFDIQVCQFLGVCNGMVCLSNRSKAESCMVYIWNPLTKDHITIPSPVPSLLNAYSVTFGFGFDRVMNEYKVIRFVSPLASKHKSVACSVFTLGTNSWRSLGSIPYHIYSSGAHPLVSGALHWFPAAQVIVSFDIKGECFREIPQPKGIKYGCITIGDLSGLLCMFCTDSNEVDIWVMKEYGVAQSWVKQFTLERPEIDGPYKFLGLLGFAKNGEVIMQHGWNRKFIMYNSKTRTSSMRSLPKHLLWFDTHMYVGSVASPTLINGAMRIDGVE